MLHTQTVSEHALTLLKKLLALKEMKSFNLVGGTALSLQYGHRISIDLDLFTTDIFNPETVLNGLQTEFGTALQYEGGTGKFGIFAYIDNVKVDIIRYAHPMIFEILEIEGIRMYNSKDISAMKIQAIFGRGKKKDFWDIAELLQKFSLADMINFHRQKYPSHQLLISIPQALTYFSDADESEDPVSLKGQTWESVKKIIQQHVNDYLK